MQQALNVQKADPALLKEVSRGSIKLRTAAKNTSVKFRPTGGAPVLNLPRAVAAVMKFLDQGVAHFSEDQRKIFFLEIIREVQRRTDGAIPFDA